MSEITQITDYEARLLALLPGQFREGANWQALNAALAVSAQEQEDLLFSLWQQRSDLAEAEGAQLDQWGAVVGLPREGWTDASYVARIRVWLQVLRSNGTPDELLRILSAGSGVALGAGLKYWEHPPASYSLQVTTDLWTEDPELAKDLARYIAKADPAGAGIGQIVIAPAVSPFILGAAPNLSTASVTRGLLCVDAGNVVGV